MWTTCGFLNSLPASCPQGCQRLGPPSIAWENPSTLYSFHLERRPRALSHCALWPTGSRRLPNTGLCHMELLTRSHRYLSQATCFGSTFALPWLTSKMCVYVGTRTKDPKSNSLLWFILQAHPRSIEGFYSYKYISMVIK